MQSYHIEALTEGEARVKAPLRGLSGCQCHPGNAGFPRIEGKARTKVEDKGEARVKAQLRGQGPSKSTTTGVARPSMSPGFPSIEGKARTEIEERGQSPSKSATAGVTWTSVSPGQPINDQGFL